MARLRYNNAVGQLGAALLADAGPDTINFGLTAPPFATLVAPDYIPLILDPPGGATPNPTFEVVSLTAYTAAALTGTISRAQEGTTAQAHANGAVWRCGPTGRDGAWLIENVNVVAASGAAQTIPEPWTATQNKITLTANCTMAFPAAAAGKKFLLALQQDGTGNRSAIWPTNVKWPGGAIPVLSTAPNVTDILEFVCLDGTNWLGWMRSSNMFLSSAAALTGIASALNSGNNALVTIPATTKVGDLILVFGSYSGQFLNAPSAPTGYATVVAPFAQTNNAVVVVALYSKTAVAGDIGATLTVPGFNPGAGTGWAEVRTYTTAGIDTTLTSTAAAGSISPPAPVSANANERQVSFFGGGVASGASVTGASLAAGGQDTETTFMGTRFAAGAEDWPAMGAAGSSESGGGGAFSMAGTITNPQICAISVLLKASVG